MNGVMLDLGFVQIYWYSICIVLGMAIGMAFVYNEASKKGISESAMTDIIFYTVLLAIIGARLWYVIFQWKDYQNNVIGIFEIWHGGLAIHGAIIFGGLFLVVHSMKKKIETLRLLDICCVGLIIGQAIGRWGNFFNQEVYGKVVSLEYLKGWHFPSFIIDGMKIHGEYHQPLFLYESILCLIGFGVLLFVRRRKYIKTGQIFSVYCIWYGTVRLILEGMRDEEYNLMLGSLKVSRIISIGMILVGIFFFVRRMRTSRFDHLYNEEIVLTNAKDEGDVSTPYVGYSYDSTNDAGINIKPKPAPKAVEPEDDSLIMNTTPIVNSILAVPQQQEPVQQAPQVSQQDATPVASSAPEVGNAAINRANAEAANNLQAQITPSAPVLPPQPTLQPEQQMPVNQNPMDNSNNTFLNV